MKKIKILILSLIIIFVATPIVFAFDTELFSIDLPEGYTYTAEEATNSDTSQYTFSKGLSAIAVIITKNTFYKDFNSLTEEELSAFTELLLYGMNSSSDQAIFEKISEERTTFGKGNYPCLKATFKMSELNVYMQIFITMSEEHIAGLIVTSFSELSFFESQEIKSSLASFELKSLQSTDTNTPFTPGNLQPNTSNNENITSIGNQVVNELQNDTVSNNKKDKDDDNDDESDITLYLIIALLVVSILFVIALISVIVLACKRAKSKKNVELVNESINNIDSTNNVEPIENTDNNVNNNNNSENL